MPPRMLPVRGRKAGRCVRMLMPFHSCGLSVTMHPSKLREGFISLNATHTCAPTPDSHAVRVLHTGMRRGTPTSLHTCPLASVSEMETLLSSDSAGEGINGHNHLSMQHSLLPLFCCQLPHACTHAARQPCLRSCSVYGMCWFQGVLMCIP